MFRTAPKVLAAVAAAVALAACNADQPAGDAALPAFPVAAPLVETVADWDAFSGQFAAPERVDVRARVSGYLDSVHFEDGQQVQQGDLLFVLDARPYEAAVANARGELARAEAQLSQAGRELEREQTLREARAASVEELETAESALEQAEAAHSAAAAILRERELDLEFTRVTAPISGRVSDRRVDPGNLVAAGDDVLTTVVATDPIHFEFDASEAALLNYQRQGSTLDGAPVQIRLQGADDFRWQGVVTFTDNVVDAATGTIRMRAEVANPEGLLRPGMFGEARVQGSQPYEAVLVPQTAILADATRRLLYVVGEDGMVEARSVTLGAASGEFRVVTAGLERDERIIVSGLLGVQPGMTVDPQLQTLARTPAPAASAAAPSGYGGGVAAAAALPVE
jgi:RND family efflux transporter MFP subunit